MAQQRQIKVYSGSTHFPICVDLDGTLLRTDLLFESFISLFKKTPHLALLSLVVLLFKGRAQFKSYISEYVKLDMESLPYRKSLLEWLKGKSDQGHPIYLVTASNEKVAKSIAAYLGIFLNVFASSESVNLKGSAKAKLLNEAFGEYQYIYVGDSKADLHIWKHAAECIVVGRNASSLSRKLRSFKGSLTVLGEERFLASLVLELRPKQWVKNILLFAPIVMAHKLTNLSALFSTSLAFIAFCSLASATYIVNDLVDLESDRRHNSKKLRPLASGNLSIKTGVVISLVLLLFTSALCIYLPYGFFLSLGLYLFVTLSYSFSLKRIIAVDVICLACLYTLRAIAGGLASDTILSHWFLMFSLFFFTSLACIKRATELLAAGSNSQDAGLMLSGRGYAISDLTQVSIFGASTGYISVMVLALFIGNPDTRIIYTSPEVLWLLCPVLLYWVNRMWILCYRRLIDDDPIVFALKDRASYLCGLIVCVIILAAL